MAGTTVNVSIRMDAKLKMEAEELFSQLGLSFGAAVHVFVRQAVRRGGIPFKVRLGKEWEKDRTAEGKGPGESFKQGEQVEETLKQEEYSNLEEFFAKLDAG